MGIKISDLTSASSLTGSEELPIVQAGNTKKATIQQVKAQNYSTTEQVVGTWIDGKPLYRQTFVGNAPTTATTGTNAVGFISIPETIDYAFVESAFVDRTADAGTPQIQPIPHVAFANNILLRLTCNIIFYYTSGMPAGTTKAIRLWNNDSGVLSTYKFVVNLLYTKSTDTATQTRSANLTMNTGSLVGSGEKGNLLLEDFSGDTTEEEKDEEELPIEEIPLEEKTEVKESGENDELR